MPQTCPPPLRKMDPAWMWPFELRTSKETILGKAEIKEIKENIFWSRCSGKFSIGSANYAFSGRSVTRLTHDSNLRPWGAILRSKWTQRIGGCWTLFLWWRQRTDILLPWHSRRRRWMYLELWFRTLIVNISELKPLGNYWYLQSPEPKKRNRMLIANIFVEVATNAATDVKSAVATVLSYFAILLSSEKYGRIIFRYHQKASECYKSISLSLTR